MEIQRTDEWFKKRTTRVTGSAVGAILGLSPWSKREDVMRRMVREYHNYPSEFQGNIATEYGIKNESTAIFDYSLQTGNQVKSCGFFTKYDWLGASPDGLIGEDGLIEVKCPFKLRNDVFPNFKSISKQPYYFAQLQLELYCTERKWIDFYQWNEYGASLERVFFDESYIEKILPELKKFHNEYLIEREIDNAKKYLQEKVPKINSEQAKVLINEYEQIVNSINELSERKKQLMSLIVELAKGQDSIVCEKKLTKVNKEGSINYAKAIEELLPNIDLSAYKGQSTSYWRLS